MMFNSNACKILLGDCLELMKELEDESIDMILTDPPYMISREAKIARSRNPLKRGKYKGNDISLMFGEWDIFETEDQYWEFIYAALEQFKRILKTGSHMLIFFDKFKITPLVEWCRKNDFIARQPLWWLKSNPCPMARKVSFMSAHELIFWATKHTTSRKVSTFHFELGQHPDYFVHCIPPKKSKSDGIRQHPCQKPVKLMEWLISYLSNENDTILDPFAGSGTTGVAAINLNRKCILIEKSPHYYSVIISRLKPLLSQRNLNNI